METTFEHQIADSALQERIRAELTRTCPAITGVEFGPRVRVTSSAPVDPARIEEAIARARYLFRTIAKDLFYESPHAPKSREDPLPHLLETRQVIEVSPGQYLLKGEFLALVRALDARAMQIARALGAEEQDYPSFVPVDLLKRTNYFKDFPHHIMVVAPLDGAHEALERFASRHDSSKRDFEVLDPDGGLGEIRLVAPPSVCYTCYYALRERPLLADAVVTAKIRCARNEPTGFRALTRLQSFTMREIIALGTKEFVLGVRQRFLEALRALTDELELSARIESANDPFFTNDAALKAVFQHSLKLKYEWLVRLPYREDSVAVASVNLHQDAFGKAFRIALAGGDPMYSACIGFGLERWAYALLSQFGPDPRAWPPSIRNRIPSRIDP